jgi:hypothetical protein
MAKRKRLTPAQPDALSEPAAAPRRGPLSAPPIAQVAGEASAAAALTELSAEMDSARAEGRIIETVPLEAIDTFHLVRDRLVMDDEEMSALMDSLRARGQQMPIELVPLTDHPEGLRYGLVSGWRRLTALKRLLAETGDARFARVRAMVIRPETAQDAYVAMVEENEIRVNLSFYERARIALRAMHAGVFDDMRSALRGLYGSTTRSKRSKIGSFVPLVDLLDDVLLHPAAISEKLGLALAREIVRSPEFVFNLRDSLTSAPRETPAEEMRILAAAVMPTPAPSPEPETGPDTGTDTGPDTGGPDPQPPAPRGKRETLAPGIEAVFAPNRTHLVLEGPGVDARFMEDLRAWIAARRG